MSVIEQGVTGQQRNEHYPSPFEPVIIDAIGALQASHASGDLAVRLDLTGFGGLVHLASGEEIAFVPASLNPDDFAYFSATWQQVGISDSESYSGVSILHDNKNAEKPDRRHVFVSGLTSKTPPPHVVRLQEDDTYSTSSLRPEEVVAIGRITFLTQLVGYVADGYPDQKTGQDAVDAFIEDFTSRDGTYDRNFFRNMLQAPRQAGKRPGQTTVLIPRVTVEGVQFSDVIDKYRNPGYETDLGAYKLVRGGQYMPRIFSSLGRMLGTDTISLATKPN